MSIIDLQRSIAEAGRIRIGIKVVDGGKSRPAKLDTFRLTSPDRLRIDQVAELLGGEVKPWQAPAGPQWEVVTAATAIDVIVPPQAMAFSQYYEMWSGGGCQRRCDGQTELLSESPCLCDPELRAAGSKDTCDYHTRLSVMIRDLPGLALWRIDTQGYYAARELAGAVEIMTLAAGRGVLLPARLLLEQRTVKRPGANGRPQTLRFPVPRLDPGITPGELIALPPVQPVSALGDGERPRFLPVPRDESPIPSIAEQSAPPEPKPARKNAAPEIPASGRRRGGPKQEGDDGYWRARAFADGAERDIDADRMRAIAAEVLGEHAEEFSMSDLSEADWERIHKVIVGFPPSAGDVVDGQAVEVEEDPDPAAVDQDTGEVAPAKPAGLSREDLLAGLNAAGIDMDYAIERSKSLYPREAGVPLTDDQRGELLAELKREAAQEAAAAAL